MERYPPQDPYAMPDSYAMPGTVGGAMPDSYARTVGGADQSYYSPDGAVPEYQGTGNFQ